MPSDGVANTSRNESPWVSTSRPSNPPRRSRTTAWCFPTSSVARRFPRSLWRRVEPTRSLKKIVRTRVSCARRKSSSRARADAEITIPSGASARSLTSRRLRCRRRAPGRRVEDVPWGTRARPCVPMVGAASGHRTKRRTRSQGHGVGGDERSRPTRRGERITSASSASSSAGSRRAGARCARVRPRGRSCRAGAAGGAPSRPSCCGPRRSRRGGSDVASSYGGSSKGTESRVTTTLDAGVGARAVGGARPALCGPHRGGATASKIAASRRLGPPRCFATSFRPPRSHGRQDAAGRQKTRGHGASGGKPTRPRAPYLGEAPVDARRKSTA